MNIKLPLWLVLLVALGAYTYAGFWTYGWVWNKYPPTKLCFYNKQTQKHDIGCYYLEHGPFEGLVWPVFWAGKWAIEATE